SACWHQYAVTFRSVARRSSFSNARDTACPGVVSGPRKCPTARENAEERGQSTDVNTQRKQLSGIQFCCPCCSTASSQGRNKACPEKIYGFVATRIASSSSYPTSK